MDDPLVAVDPVDEIEVAGRGFDVLARPRRLGGLGLHRPRGRLEAAARRLVPLARRAHRTWPVAGPEPV